VPDKADRDYINSIIFTELFKEEFKDSTRKKFINIMEGLHAKGVEGIILGCTEIPLLIKQKHVDIPLFDTLDIHANAIVEFALDESLN
jgi:aspartate racemase